VPLDVGKIFGTNDAALKGHFGAMLTATVSERGGKVVLITTTLGITILIAGCCSKSTGTHSAALQSSPSVHFALPSYVATDYDKPGRPGPFLAAADIARIQTVLARVKPCQRPLVRYAGGDGSPIVLFFAVKPGEGAHVLGTADEFYDPATGSVVPGSDNQSEEQMQKQGLQWDIDHQACP
jgi:hypothetical protein